MIDRNSQFMAILTNVGAAKLANANALGIPWNLTALGVGDANGTDPVPSATQIKLINEQRRAPLNQLRVDPANAAVIIAEQVIPADVGGWWIREIGLYDSDGDLVAVSNCAPSFKPALDQGSGRTQIVRMNFIVSSINNIVLKIDPAIVLATREYVDLAITEAINKQDFKHSVLVATTTNIALTGIQTIDGVLLVEGSRVLVKDQNQAKDNGIYVVPTGGAWKRAQDADASVEVTPGLFVSVETGALNGDSVWQLVTDAPIVLGTTALAFEMAVGRTGVIAGSYANVTVDKYGRVIAGTNPTTLAGHGITDAISSTPQAGVVGKIADIAKNIVGVYASGTTDSHPDSNGGLFLRMKYPGATAVAFDILGHVGGGYDIFGFRRVLADGSYVWRTVWHSGNFDPTLKANLASPAFTGLPTAPLAPAANSNQIANTAFVWNAVNTYATTVTASLAGKADKDKALAVGVISQQQPVLASPSTGSSAASGGLIIREATAVGAAQSGEDFSPGIGFYWLGQAAGKLIMDAFGKLKWNGLPILTGAIASQNEVDTGSTDTNVVTPFKMRFGFAMSFTAASGYVLFPTWLGGLLIQYGRLTLAFDVGTTFTWPIAWPDACYALSSGVLSSLARAEDGVTGQFRLLTKTNVVVDRQDISVSATGNRDIFVWGVGK
ncbi:phage tail protein [Pseudomonas azotoformans]